MVLNHYLAQAGIASRRQAAELIKNGHVSVNQITVTDPSYRVQETDAIKINNKKLSVEKKIYILLNKPIDYVTTTADEQGRSTVLELLPRSIAQRIYPVGRLDIDTSGLLLLTNDGALAQKLTHPSYEITKEYVALLQQPFKEGDFETLINGVYLKDGKTKADHAYFVKNRPPNWVKIILHSGKFRVVKRLFASLNYTVQSLDRVRFAGLTKKGLAQGKWRFLLASELKKLQLLVEHKKPSKSIGATLRKMPTRRVAYKRILTTFKKKKQ